MNKSVKKTLVIIVIALGLFFTLFSGMLFGEMLYTILGLIALIWGVIIGIDILSEGL